MVEISQNLRHRLENQLARGDLVLFTGAGFSGGAVSRSGQPIPSVGELRSLLWGIAFPGEESHDGSSLGDIFEVAAARAGNQVRDLLRDRLTVDAEALPDSYRAWYSFPWFRIYTLNVDDLDEAVDRKFVLPQHLRSVSALTEGRPQEADRLLSIHLNGRIGEYPDVTFTARDYGQRTVSPDPWYEHLVADLFLHPVVFVGTQLDEPPLWHHMELRGRKGGGRELRQGSYLVSPSLPAARRALLSRYNIDWVSMDHQTFLEQVLSDLTEEAGRGHQIIRARRRRETESAPVYRITDSLEQEHSDLRDFLLGRQPSLADLTAGYAIEREFEEEIRTTIDSSDARVVVLTGTAGTGKSTTLLRLGLEYEAEGHRTYILDVDTELPISWIRQHLRELDASILLVDDADAFGRSSGPILADLHKDNPEVLIIAAIRSARYENLDIEFALKDVESLQFTVPHLGDSDIDSLLAALESANRLGRLLGLTPEQRIRAFRQQAGRQLLVAMIEATSGERFDEKIERECADLGLERGLMYAIVAIATSRRTYLTREEVLMAIGDQSNEALNHFESLVTQGLLTRVNEKIRLRHRVVADRALTYFQGQGQLAEPIKGLLFVMAAKSHPGQARTSRERQLLVQLLNHDYLLNLSGEPNVPREAYSGVEDLLRSDYHYWLQRGSLEVEVGDIRLARVFLENARALAPDDYMVQTEWAYMMIQRAAQDDHHPEAPDWVEEALAELDDAIQRRGPGDPYLFHVWGAQSLAWANRGRMSREERGAFLGRALKVVRDGRRFHPRNPSLIQLERDVEEAYLMTAAVDLDEARRMNRPRGEVDE